VRIFVFEYTTGGGLLPGASSASAVGASASRRLDNDLLAEGQAMVMALASDFGAIANCDVHILRDSDVNHSLPPGAHAHVVRDFAEYTYTFDEQAAAADWTVVIAPESAGALLACAERVLTRGGRLLSPCPDIIRLASDKQATAEHLTRAGVIVPSGALAGPHDSFPAGLAFPLVMKPQDGAGSQGVRLVRSADEYAASIQEHALARVEVYCPGEAVSVATLCGPRGNLSLAPCRQRLSDDGRFTYLGGSTPLPPALADRAAALASRAVATLAGVVGYLGVDLVLGPDQSGADDRVIEINPRLTTSYVGLRAAYDGNLAAAMLDLAEGRPGRLCAKALTHGTRVEW
jgi:predicted ATP-grasp superfamily ATP-dependent carboligase